MQKERQIPGIRHASKCITFLLASGDIGTHSGLLNNPDRYRVSIDFPSCVCRFSAKGNTNNQRREDDCSWELSETNSCMAIETPDLELAIY